MNKIWLIMKKVYSWVDVPLEFCAILFMFIPEEYFKYSIIHIELLSGFEVISNRLLILFAFILLYYIYITNTEYVIGKYHDNIFEIRYGDIFSFKESKIVIPFTECYTTQIGDGPNEIKKRSVCGQFLRRNEINITDVRRVIDNKEYAMPDSVSNYNNLPSYKLGILIPYQRFLLMSFGKLNNTGLSEMTYDEYLGALFNLWKEIEKYYGDSDVCIPIIGSGRTKIDGKQCTKKELIDIIIMTYKISRHKLKLSNKLIIVCKKDAIGINDIRKCI